MAPVVAKAVLPPPVKVPQAGLVDETLNITLSPLTRAAPLVDTVAVIVDVLVPLAVMLDGLAVAVTVKGEPAGAGLVFWSMVPVPVAPVVASVADRVQNPGVVDAT